MTLTYPRTACAAAAAALLFLFAFPAAAVRADGEPTAEQQERVEAIGSRLAAAVTSHPDEYTWPPVIKVTTEAAPDNACAFVEGTDKDSGKQITHVNVSPSLLVDIIKDSDDTLAFIMGHELTHVLLKHNASHPDREKTSFLSTTFTRQQEYEADAGGIKMALAAGYSFKRAMSAPREFISKGMDYSSFEASGVDHPSWKDRIAAMDKDQGELWRSMSAFDNGQYFLTVEQYDSASRCFAAVTDSFPDCAEAWSNLGYCRLMQYCDALQTADIRRMGLGQIVVGGFYQRPRSLEAKERGLNPHFWQDSIVALNRALTLNPSLTLAKANLALACLVSPDGKKAGRASQLFQEAATLAAGDTTIDPYTRAAVLVNAGVSDIARGQLVAGRLKIDRGERAATALAGPGRTVVSTLADAVLYNRALLLANSAVPADQVEAITEMEKYLHSASSASAWWPLAFERYTALCKTRGVVPKTQTALRSDAATHLRPLNTLEIIPGKPLTISDPLRRVTAVLGETTPIPLVPDTNLVQMNYPQYGVHVLATNIVLAVCLSGPTHPGLMIRGTGLGAAQTALHVGMTKAELGEAIKEDYEFTQIIDPEKNYRFYRSLGLAVLVRGGVVQELMIVQVPRQ